MFLNNNESSIIDAAIRELIAMKTLDKNHLRAKAIELHKIIAHCSTEELVLIIEGRININNEKN